MNSFTEKFAMENKRRLERNSNFYYEYRNAVAGVLNQLPRDCPLMGHELIEFENELRREDEGNEN